jgi:hypothetical protein
MPPHRRPIQRLPAVKVTPEAVELFRRGVEIMECDDHKFWEEDGGRRAEWLKISSDLEISLKLAPWDTSPLDVAVDGTPPRWADDDMKGYERAVALRRTLEDAI